ncbi:MAG: ComF family protein [Limosilactobacillus sp.]|uniref:ComF family protein n=1 Tax=Limosilactobacillus sp. TaxID=2773925 RepID=UPI0027118B67|nr:ComF family protein [Limosilactobacillus sp.]
MCSRPQPSGEVCGDCQRWQKVYPWKIQHHGLYRYNDAMKAYIQSYKFSGDYRLRHVFAEEMKAEIKKYDVDLVIPIPVTDQTMATRGFNQVRGWLEGVDLDDSLATKMEEKVAQSKKNRQERLKTPQIFNLNNPSEILGKRVLLVDDIYTTGRTIYHASECLYNAGAASVVSLSLAR